MSILAKYTEIVELVASMKDDIEKFQNKGNAAAATRARKGLQNVKRISQELRKEIQEKKNKEKAAKAAAKSGKKKSSSKKKPPSKKKKTSSKKKKSSSKK